MVQPRILERRFLSTKVNKDKVTLKEQVIGYFFSPAGTAALNAILITYVNIFYTDVLKIKGFWGGAFLVVLPIVSKFISIIVNIIFGRIIDKTKTVQGKARPWLLLSAPLILVSSILLFLNLNLSETEETILIFVLYNLYFSFAYTIYNMSHSLLVPLSSSDEKERNTFSIITSIGQTFGNGVFAIGIFTLLIYPFLKVSPSYWLSIVSIFAVASFVAIIFEYFFTVERIEMKDQKVQTLSFKEQMKALFTDKYWLLIAFLTIVYSFGSELRSISLIYYCEWTLGTYENYRVDYALIQMVGGLPLWIGAFFVKPLVEKIGKQKAIGIGLFIAALGDGIEYLFMRNVTGVVIGAVIRNIGLVPICYSFTALLADVMDEIWYKNGQRCDGAVISADSVIRTIFSGLATGMFNMSLVIYSYQEPDSSKAVQTLQNEGMQNTFGLLFAGIPALCALASGLFVLFLDVEKKNKERKESNIN
jgi:GPH family glycoside/pentoside/hexuronide:cation symporter